MAVDEAVVAEVFCRLLGRGIVAVERLAGGRNSQVFRVDCEGSAPNRFVAKQYFSIPEDPRDRLQTEYRALQFLRARGIASVPKPIAMDANVGCAIYEFAPGERASAGAVTAGDIRQAVAFLAELRSIARRTPAAEAPLASEACFSIDAVAASVAARLARLRSLPDDGRAGELHRFLDQRFGPFVAALDAWTDEQVHRGVDRTADIASADRTLSPSDFGFHNALRDGDGRLVFVDLEYFGWDDPAKTIVDFLHHPAMLLTDAQRRTFVAGALGAFSDIEGLSARARVVYPWFGLKWCAILLNEFVPEHLRRRRFAAVAETDRTELQRRQLDRAARLLDRLEGEYQSNPYFD